MVAILKREGYNKSYPVCPFAFVPSRPMLITNFMTIGKIMWFNHERHGRNAECLSQNKDFASLGQLFLFCNYDFMHIINGEKYE